MLIVTTWTEGMPAEFVKKNRAIGLFSKRTTRFATTDYLCSWGASDRFPVFVLPSKDAERAGPVTEVGQKAIGIVRGIAWVINEVPL